MAYAFDVPKDLPEDIRKFLQDLICQYVNTCVPNCVDDTTLNDEFCADYSYYVIGYDDFWLCRLYRDMDPENLKENTDIDQKMLKKWWLMDETNEDWEYEYTNLTISDILGRYIFDSCEIYT